MSNVYSLEDLKNDLDREFAPLTIGVRDDAVVLCNLMRLNAKQRKSVLDALEEVQKYAGSDTATLGAQDMEALISAVHRVILGVAKDNKGNKLVDGMGDDLGLAMKILELWMEATQPGEATSSPS